MTTRVSDSSRHWLRVALSFLKDAGIVWLAFLVGTLIRFHPGDEGGGLAAFSSYLPGVALASVLIPSVLYVGGLYSSRMPRDGFPSFVRWITCAWLVGLAAILVIGSLDYSARIGRGVIFLSFGLVGAVLAISHSLSYLRRRRRWQTALCLVRHEDDEAAATLLHCLWGKHTRSLGVIIAGGYSPRSDLPVIGNLDEEPDIADHLAADLLLVRDGHLASPDLSPIIRRMRYQGVEVVSLADACEEAYQAVPLELVTESWLFKACSQSGPFYVRKLKRILDIAISLMLLVGLSPFLAFGCLAIRLSSPGPMFYRQERCGRLGRSFTITKLRTMTVDSEKAGAQWSSKQDNRVFPAGKFLRKFRIDEIPQLWNIIRGEMSFVGPRPERPEFVKKLETEIPVYRERLFVHPGLTGWAQVKYPYGSSVEDAKRKLEFDLYYMKHMSPLLDFFIFLETIKTVLFGGVRAKGLEDYQTFRKGLETANSVKVEHESPRQRAVV